MLPFTTYIIPENPVNKTVTTGKWLAFITDQAFSISQTELVQKISTALKADFDVDTYTWRNGDPQHGSDQPLLNSTTSLVISFGILPSTIGTWIDLQIPGIRFLESFSFILTLPINDLENNAPAKKELWKNMQMYMEMNE